MKKALVCVLALVMVISLVACSGGSIVGKWAFGVNTYEFREDNTVSVSINNTLNYDGTYTVDGDKVTLTVKGLIGEQTVDLTWSVKGSTLTLTGDVTLSGASSTLTFERV
ncbi:MAG: DUF5640 domain-containing protein [Acutalibacteraceae bacterium]|jgi:uncharacterized lipoprotein YehR (DUF1307 family)